VVECLPVSSKAEFKPQDAPPPKKRTEKCSSDMCKRTGTKGQILYNTKYMRNLEPVISWKQKLRLIAGCWWLMSVILAAWEVEMRRSSIRDQPGQTVCETHLQNNLSKMNWKHSPRDRVTSLQAGSPEFKAHSHPPKN
jgi:hypothetical protein